METFALKIRLATEPAKREVLERTMLIGHRPRESSEMSFEAEVDDEDCEYSEGEFKASIEDQVNIYK